jgi:hypothetical protein
VLKATKGGKETEYKETKAGKAKKGSEYRDLKE